MNRTATPREPLSLTAELRRNRRRRRTGAAFREPGAYMAYLRNVLSRLTNEVEALATRPNITGKAV